MNSIRLENRRLHSMTYCDTSDWFQDEDDGKTEEGNEAETDDEDE